jgi:hypothetical protein
MRRFLLSAVVVGGVLGAAGSTIRAGEDPNYIPCPVKSVRAEIVTTLPDPWWQTPQEGGVVSLTVETIAGAPTLVCHYEAYGRTVPVMHPFPKGVKTCSPKGEGFYCR